MEFILNKLELIRKRFRLIIFLSAVIVTASAYYKYIYLPDQVKDIKLTKVKRGNLEETLTVSGEIDADEKATLRFQTSGRLAWIGVEEGDYVKKYQTIASLDLRELEKKLQKELNDYMNQRWDFEQTTKDDYKDQVITDKIKRILEKAQFNLDNTVLDVEIANLAKEYANLWSPIEGIVTKVETPHAGTNMTPANAEFEIINPKSIYFLASADQTEVTSLSEGLSGELVLDSYEDETFPGTIANISFVPKSGETGTVYSVEFFFDNSCQGQGLSTPGESLRATPWVSSVCYKYRLGMTGDLTFVTKTKENLLYLPVKFVKREEGKDFVTKRMDGKEAKVFVKTGMETDDVIEIVSGVSEGEVVYE